MLVSVAICLGGYLPMLGFYRYLLGKLSCDVRVLFLFAGGVMLVCIAICLGVYPLMLGFFRYVLGTLSCDVGFLLLFAWRAIL